MEHSEMIEKLHNQAGISPEVAEDALRRSGWDMLEALRLLEKEGKIKPLTSSMTTTDEREGYEEVKATASGKDGSAWERFKSRLKELFSRVCEYSFVVRRGGNIIVNLPVIVVAVIFISAWQVTLGVLLVGLFFECGYTFEHSPAEYDGKEDESR